jgi:glucose dehydrogenase
MDIRTGILVATWLGSGMLAFSTVATATALPDTAALRNDAHTTADVLTYGMGYDQKRFSPLA